MDKTILIAFSLLATTFGSRQDKVDNNDMISEDGYYFDGLDEILPASASETLQCPSTNVIRTRYKCRGANNDWVDCTRAHCCPEYTLLNGQCIAKGTDPCGLNLCEQQCSVLMQRVICTCWDGYKFNPERQKLGLKPVCVDVDECAEGISDCEQICVNDPGGFSCACREGFFLRGDNRTCEEKTGTNIDGIAAASRCYANCDTVLRLHDKVKKLQEKIVALSTAIRLSSYASGPPGPMGPPGAQGLPGPRGFPGADGISSHHPNLDSFRPLDHLEREPAHSVLDSFAPSNNGYCKCQRGPVGPVGPPGETGDKGDRGERGSRGPRGPAGSFDFLLLLLADVRHDIVLLQEKVFKDVAPRRFDIQSALKKHRFNKERSKLQKQHKIHRGGSVSVSPKELSRDIVPNSEIEEFRDVEVDDLLADYVYEEAPENSGDDLYQYDS